jgi:hypothetical protein
LATEVRSRARSLGTRSDRDERNEKQWCEATHTHILTGLSAEMVAS